VGFATRQVGNRTKPNLIVSVDDQGVVCLKSQSTFKTTEIKFKLNEQFDETTADDRKTKVCYLHYRKKKNKKKKYLLCTCIILQTVMTLENGKLIQKQTWDGKETSIEREITDGKLIA
ncbi:hypothetical protein NL108_005308, partial [Boleophthalmus pectinirostris]